MIIGKARVAQLVEHNLAKVGVAGSNPVSRSFIFKATYRTRLRRAGVAKGEVCNPPQAGKSAFI